MDLNVSLLIDLVASYSSSELQTLEERLGAPFHDFLEDLLARSDFNYSLGRYGGSDGLNSSLTSSSVRHVGHPQATDHRRVTRCLLLYLPPVLIVAGTIGNALSAAVLSTGEMARHPTSSYLVALSLADTAVLYLGLFRFWIVRVFGLGHLDSSDIGCKLINFASTTASNMAAWLLVAVTIDRYLGVCQPLKAQASGVSGRLPRVVIWSIISVFLLLNLHFFWTVSSGPVPGLQGKEHYGWSAANETRTTFRKWPREVRLCRLNDNVWALKVWPWIDMFLYSFLPFVLLLVFNSFIIRAITLSRRFRCSSKSTELQDRTTLTKTISCSLRTGQTQSKERQNGSGKRQPSPRPQAGRPANCEAEEEPSQQGQRPAPPNGSVARKWTASGCSKTESSSRRLRLDSNARISLMLLVVSFSYVLLTLPMNLTMIAAAFLNERADSMRREDARRIESSFGLVRAVSELLMYLNHAVNFYLYCLTGTAFRRHLRRAVCHRLGRNFRRLLGFFRRPPYRGDKRARPQRAGNEFHELRTIPYKRGDKNLS